MEAINKRLEELRTELRAERISYGELAELQTLIPHIDKGDVELLEAAGVPEFEEFEDLPQNVLDILDQCTGDEDYEDCKRIIKELNEIGWTADFGLSAELFDFKKL